MRTTKIEWTERTWNPITGCSKISEGCEHCYAERMAKRLAGRAGYRRGDPFGLTIHLNKMEEPFKWRKPCMVFVCSMGDIFHEGVVDAFRDVVFNQMEVCPEHTFQVLTKRPQNALRYLGKPRHLPALKNLWLGVTAENQARADERIPILLQIPAAVRFVSVEPMLGPVNMAKVPGLNKCGSAGQDLVKNFWVICGPETGPGARKMEIQWARGLRDQCEVAGVPFFYKRGRLDGKEYHNYPVAQWAAI